MVRPTPWTGRVRGLDGLRGLAVAAVLVYHLDATWLPGGFLGVSLFFTLSGYLITTLLLREQEEQGTVALRSFWTRRARRLLPASLGAILLAVVVGVAVGDAGPLRSLPGDVLASLTYVANWRFVANHTAYGAAYEAPSLLAHFWSLAIEEQFYLLFPLAVLALRGRSRLRVALVVAIAASVGAGVWLHDPLDPARTYFGTDVRAAELLVGALLAASTTPARLGRLGWAADALGTVGLLGSAALWATADPGDAWLHRGGFSLVAVLSATLIVAALGHGPVARSLGTRGLVAAGTVSYGLYVYHWPLFEAISQEHTGLHGPVLVLLRLAPTVALAAASHRWLEQPVRQGRGRWAPRRLAAVAVGMSLLALGGALSASGLADGRAVAGEAPSVQLAGPDRPTVAPPTTAPLEAPTRVLLVGDSLLHQGLPTFSDRFGAVGMDVEALGGPGESLLHEQGAWRTDVDQAVQVHDPDVVVLESCCGFGSARLDTAYLLDDGTEAVPDTEATWSAWWRAADELVTVARARGAVVLWVLAPPASTNGYYGPVEARIEVANDGYRRLASCRGDLGLVDWGRLAAPDGSYAESLPDAEGRPVKVRADDGLHFTLDGQALLADLTVDAVLARWRAVGGRSEPRADVATTCGEPPP